jgi:membrane-bound lytic murein transglycosylase A
VVIAQPEALPPAPPIITRPPPPIQEAPEEPVVERPSAFSQLVGWSTTDTAPAFAAFQRSCQIWQNATPSARLAPKLPQYGTFADWAPACAASATVTDPRSFFEIHFAPVELATPTDSEGLLTGYYEPEISVRRVPDRTYSEPILAKPASASVQRLPRSKINANTSRVIAYGKPIDVFFMQIQGTGRIRYEDGLTLRAAYAGHNSKSYTSIGAKLVEWGEMTLSEASKGSIERWMENAGPMRARALMNENARYIFFEEQSIPEGSGPQGAMRAPLTGMGSIALDPRYHPYGTVALLRTTLPQVPGDYRGAPANILVVGQDTGGAIKGPLRGDLFFGSGDYAGELAGVMKHPVGWTLLLPVAIAGSLAQS